MRSQFGIVSEQNRQAVSCLTFKSLLLMVASHKRRVYILGLSGISKVFPVLGYDANNRIKVVVWERAGFEFMLAVWLGAVLQRPNNEIYVLGNSNQKILKDKIAGN